MDAQNFLDPCQRPDIEKLTPVFQTDKFYCLDGGFASSLQAFYQKDIDTDPLWSCRALKTDPEAVIQTHEAFLEAGANIITTNTYQGHHELFRTHIKDFKDPCIDPHLLLEKAVELADEAILRVNGTGRSLETLVAGSIGPYGACLGDGSEYTGAYIDTVSKDFLQEWHSDRIKRLMFNQSVDIFAIETIPSYIEALAILDALKDVHGARCWISFQCKDDSHTARGEPIEEAFVQLLNHPEALRIKAVGVNCVKASNVTPILKRLNTVNNWQSWPDNDYFTKIPYIIAPNGGEDWNAVEKRWVGEIDDIICHIREWMILGANVIGGCCRVGPPKIQLIKKEIMNNIYEVTKLRLEQSRKEKRPIDQWSFDEKCLRRPPYEEQKRRIEVAKEFFRDASEDGDANAIITAQLEAMMAHNNKEMYEAIKTLERQEIPKDEIEEQPIEIEED